MKTFLTMLVTLLTTLPALTLAEVNCSRGQLQIAVNNYLAAQKAGDAKLMNLVPETVYMLNMEPSTLKDSMVQKPLKIDFTRSLLDEYACQTYSEVIVTDKAHPYVLATRMRVIAGSITELESVVTDDGDWLFNPQVTLERSSGEDWHVLAMEERTSRANLEAAANAYFDQFYSGPDSTFVPWGTPCNRLEGGIYSGKGLPTDSCNVGVPKGMNLANRRFVIDEAMGTVVGLNRMGPNLLPDSHMFRLVNGKIRYVHTLTVCTVSGCGFGPPPKAAPPLK